MPLTYSYKTKLPVPPPKLPADKALQCRIALVHKGATPTATEAEGVTEVEGLTVVEDVTLSVVSGRTARGLVPELGATLDGQCLRNEKVIVRD